MQRTSSIHPGRAALSLRWLVVLLILFGTFAMPVGSTISHGMAAVAQTLHASAPLTNTQHEHDHDHAQDYEHASSLEAGDGSFVTSADGSTSEHAHHGADHSHDPAHTPVAAWGPIPPQLVRWYRQPLLWVETVQQSRLERPPIG